MSNITLPTIHSNGTSARKLAQDYGLARRLLRDAIVALEQVEFNGRDYYPQGGDAWTQALAQHTARLTALEQVNEELAEIEQHCADHIR